MDLERGTVQAPPQMAAREPRPTCIDCGKELTEGDMTTTSRTETSSTRSSETRTSKRAREPELVLDVKLRGGRARISVELRSWNDELAPLRPR